MKPERWSLIDGKWRFRKKIVAQKKSINGTVPPKWIFDLGLAISGATMLPGQRRTHHDIACFVAAAIEVVTGTKRGVSWQRIWQIEQKALRKLRHPAKLKVLR